LSAEALAKADGGSDFALVPGTRHRNVPQGASLKAAGILPAKHLTEATQRWTIMMILNAVWRALRGISLLVVLTVIFTGVLLVSCVTRLFFGGGFADVAGKMHLGS
jgi:hypothetical protein